MGRGGLYLSFYCSLTVVTNSFCVFHWSKSPPSFAFRIYNLGDYSFGVLLTILDKTIFITRVSSRFPLFSPLLLFWINDKLDCFVSRNLAQLAKVKVMKRAGGLWEELHIHHR